MIRALAFDVFGTVVDWRGSIVREGELLSKKRRLKADWAKLADAWRGEYHPSMDRVRRGELPWTHIDTLHRMNLDSVLSRFGIDLAEEDRKELNLVWHRLTPWPDSVPGLNRLRGSYVLATLSNGNISLLVDMAKNAGLPWDCVMSGELFQHYKPDPEVYRGAAKLLDLPPEEVMMVAAHPSDLKAAARCGLKTAYVPRPLEYGPDAPFTIDRGPFDYSAESFLDLAQQLGC